MYEKLTYKANNKSIEFSVYSDYYVNFNDVDGISNLENEIYSTSTIGQFGETYQGNRLMSRNITFSGVIKTTNKVLAFQKRRDLINAISPNKQGILIYEFNGAKKKIPCLPAVTPIVKRDTIFYRFTLQFVCLMPFWQDERPTTTVIARWDDRFEFPVNITDDFVFAERNESVITNVINVGDIDTGLYITMRAIGNVTNPYIYNLRTNEFIKFKDTLLTADDEIIINTNYANKKVFFNNANALDRLKIESTFFKLIVGDNLIRYGAEAGEDNMIVDIKFNNSYVGV